MVERCLTEADAADNLAESTQAIKEGGRKRCVPTFCATRWTARLSTLSTLLSKYVEVLRTLETIRDCSSGDARHAASYIRLML